MMRVGARRIGRGRSWCAALTLVVLTGAFPGSAAGGDLTTERITRNRLIDSSAMALDAAGNHHLVYSERRRFGVTAASGLVYGTDASGSWRYSRVTWGDDFKPDIAVDLAGRVHIAFARRAPEGGWQAEIRYISNTSGAWQSSRIANATYGWAAVHGLSIALTKAASPHVVFDGGPGIEHARLVDGLWRVVRRGAGQGPSVAVGPGGSIHISYVAGPGEIGIRYATNASGAWSVSSPPSGGSVSYFDPPVIAIDQDGAAHIVYERYGTFAGVSYLTNRGGTWLRDRITIERGAHDLALDPDAVPAVAIPKALPDGTLGLRVVRRTGGSWYQQTAVGVSFHPSLASDATGTLHLLYQRPGSEVDPGLYLRRETELGWQEETARIALGDDTQPSLAIDGGGTLHLAYARCEGGSASDGVSYRSDTAGWASTRLDPACAHDVALALDGAGAVHVAWLEERGDGNVRHATNRTGTWAVTTVGQLPSLERLNGIDIAVDGLGGVHIIASELDSGVGEYRWTMRHFTDAGGSWTTETLPITGGHTVSLAARGAGRLFLVYRRERQVSEGDIERSLTYATNATASGSWVMRTVGGEDTPAGAITLDGDRKVHIAYVRTGAAVGIYHRTNASGAWVTQLINRHEILGAPDIAALDASHVVVAYTRAGDRPGIRIASKNGTVWSSVTGSARRFDRSPSLALDPGGAFRVVFDRDSDGLFLLSE